MDTKSHHEYVLKILCYYELFLDYSSIKRFIMFWFLLIGILTITVCAWLVLIFWLTSVNVNAQAIE